MTVITVLASHVPTDLNYVFHWHTLIVLKALICFFIDFDYTVIIQY